MSNPVEGPAGPNPPPSLGLNQGKNSTDNRVASVANGVFSTDPGASPLPDSLSSRVSVGEVILSKEGILKEWLESQPENAKPEAQQILDILKKIDLSRPFELDLRNRTKINSLPNILQNCTKLNCQNCTNLRDLPDLPACTKLYCHECSYLEALPALPACIELHCHGCYNLQSLPALPACTKLYCQECENLEALPALPACIELNCSFCPSLRALTALPACIELDCCGCESLQTLPKVLQNCTKLECNGCRSLETLPELPACIKLICINCASLRTLPELPACIELVCSSCSNLETLPELRVCIKLDCSNCPNLEAVLLRRDGFQVNCIDSPKVIFLLAFVDSATCEIEGVRYFPKALPEELKVLLTPPLPESASIDHLNSDFETFIKGLKESDLPTLKKEIQGEPDLASYKRKLSEWKESLFSRVQGKLAYLGTPSKGTEELKKFYEKIEYYLLHLDAFLSKEENRDALIERLRILQTQSACGARFIAELEQLFSLSCVGSETADLSNQFAQIASTEAKLAIERMFPESKENVHDINQAMFQLKDYLTGSYFKDPSSSEMHQEELIFKFLEYHTSVNLVKTIQDNLEPSSPREGLFTQYLRENFSPELTKDILEELNQDVNELWEVTKERKIAAFGAYDLVRQKPAQERTAQEKLQMVALPQDEKACQNKEELEGLLKSKEKSFKDKNIQSGVESKKDEILYQEHFDEEQNRWKPEIIAKALQKMGILATEAELFPKAN